MDFVTDQLYNGKRFRALNAQAYFNKVKPNDSRTGMPTDNLYIKSFNGGFQNECLSRNRFISL